MNLVYIEKKLLKLKQKQNIASYEFFFFIKFKLIFFSFLIWNYKDKKIKWTFLD